ncbi:MAG: hypothetical protein AAB906_01945 [Patescibacteria group bacterium]
MKFESATNLAQAGEKPKKPEKSQEELRAILEERLNSLKVPLQEGIKEYEQALQEGLFEDRDDEPAGSGEARKEATQKKLTVFFDRAEKMKAQLDGNESLSRQTSELSAQYTCPDGKKETITLDLEAKLEEFLSFYQKTDIDILPDFEDAARDIWERNYDEIKEAVEQNGFDEMLILPGNIPLADLAEKMKMENGYYESDNFKEGGSFAGAVSQNTDKPRLLLVHKIQNLKDRPELAKTLNVKGEDVKLDQVPTLDDYLVFQRKYFEETGKHLDEDGWTWLATKSGARLVRSDWHPDSRKLAVRAGGLEDRRGALGARPSRCFF